MSLFEKGYLRRNSIDIPLRKGAWPQKGIGEQGEAMPTLLNVANGLVPAGDNHLGVGEKLEYFPTMTFQVTKE
jgi:hypothetical protein